MRKGPTLSIGEIFTADGFYELLPNPDRSWWQIWKPRHIFGDLQKYVVTKVVAYEL